MVSSNKVLTVSYGTFSCTLEGFDDSFDTMKAIAEYFRDLAADDRYFGAEPPTPDAEMLARIAEKEIARRVEAREESGAIVLRAETAEAAPAALMDPATVAPDTSPEPEPAPAQVDAQTDIVSEPAPVAAPDPVAEPAPTPVVDETPADDSTPIAEIEPAAEAEPVSSEAEAEVEIPVAEKSPAEETAEKPHDDTPEVDVASSEEELENDAKDVISVAATAAPVAVAAQLLDEDSIAAKLQRIRNVVSRGAAPQPEPDFSEDEHAENVLADTVEDIEEAIAQDDQSATADTAPEEVTVAPAATEEPAPEEVAAEEPVADALPPEELTPEEAASEEQVVEEPAVTELAAEADMDTADTAPEEASVADTEPTEPAPVDAATKAAVFSAVLNAVREAKAQQSDAEDDAAPEAEDVQVEDDAPKVAEEAEAAPVAEAQSQKPAEVSRPARARVMKVKRSDFEAAVAAGKLEPDEPQKTSSLSDEEEADLLRELAEVEAEFSDPAEEQEETVDETGPEDVRSIFEDDGDDTPDAVDETDVSRLLQKTQSEMERPDGASRRNAIAHLRAAVEATRADSDAGVTARRGNDSVDAFKEDLDTVVRPRRPALRGRPKEERVATEEEAPRPAPLKLVAEQRVDSDAPEAAAPVAPVAPQKVTPVRPRRVVRVAPPQPVEEDVADFDSFADFADAQGADSLPDILEAAAAYLSYVEGHQQFSRPQLMKVARQVEELDFSREDGLRSFGQLLRQGKIEKLQGGRFTVSDQIGFKPDTRAAG